MTFETNHKKLTPEISSNSEDLTALDKTDVDVERHTEKVFYRYDNLLSSSSIRLIELLPGDEGDALQCQIRTTDFDETPTYEAISYVWGPDITKASINCGKGIIKIPPNLESALRRFRRSSDNGHARVLWADSICINQEDTKERNQQVSIMGQIYQKATGVLIWLGDEDGSTAKAWKCIDMLVGQVLEKEDEINDWMESVWVDDSERMSDSSKIRLGRLASKLDNLHSHFGLPPLDGPEFHGLSQLLLRPWFFRAWTFQESVLARSLEFYCGQFKISGLSIFCAMGALAALQRWTSDPRYTRDTHLTVSIMVQGRRTSDDSVTSFMGKNNFLDLLRLRRGSGCTNPSDLVYSLLGTVDDTFGIVPDYSKSFETVFTEFAISIIHKSKSLAILAYGGCDQGPASLPSWVPDWRMRRSGLTLSATNGPVYCCSGKSKLKISSAPNKGELLLDGLLLDTITAVENGSRQHTWLEQQLSLDPEQEYLPSQEPLRMAIVRTICLDKTRFDQENQDRRWTKDSTEHFQLLRAQSHSSAWTAFIFTSAEGTAGLPFIVTKKKRFGIAPDTVRPGDVIAILLGAEVPIILRPEEERFKFVSECYVHGFMDGEALVEAWKFTNPETDYGDSSCLDNLLEEPIPVKTREFVII